jgi:mRNA interferase MazF
MSQTSRVGVGERAPPRRGEVWLVAFDPAVGGEVRKTRPAIVLSNDEANAVLNRVQVVPVSSSVALLYPAEAYVLLNGRRRKAMADQITAVSIQRLRRRMGLLGRADIEAVEGVVRLQLGL